MEDLKYHRCNRHSSWWEHDAQGIPLARVCEKCRDIGLYHMGLLLAFGVTNAKLAGYILTGYPRAM